MIDKNERIIKIDDGNEQYCFIKVEAISIPNETIFLGFLPSYLKNLILPLKSITERLFCGFKNVFVNL